MKATKKDFKKIAEFLRINTYTQQADGFKYVPLDVIVDGLIAIFKKTNPRFDEDKFRDTVE